MTATFSFSDFIAVSPLFTLLFGGLFLIAIESFFPKLNVKLAIPFTLLTFFAALLAVLWSPGSQNPLLTDWLKFDSLLRFFSLFFLITGIATTLLSATFFQRFQASQGEFFFLLLSSVFGLILLSSAADFLILFIGLETLSIALYILCGYIKRWHTSTEASTKYFLMGALATAFLLYGIALLYGATGTTQFHNFSAHYASSNQPLFMMGIALVTLGLAFKAAIVPFHVWAPDVYDGASNPVTAFMAVATKAGAFAAFIRIFLEALPDFNPIWNHAISFLAYPTLIYGNFVAINQSHLRRFFAYSGIAHAGFLLIPLSAGGPEALSSLLFYLVIYGLATLSCFAILAFLDHQEEGVTLQDMQGLFKRSPFLAGLMAFSLLTLAGIPPTAGFLAKFFVFKVAFQANYYGLVIVGLLTTILSAYYYLRIIALMVAKTPEDAVSPPSSWPAFSLAILCMAGLTFLSFYPEPLLQML